MFKKPIAPIRGSALRLSSEALAGGGAAVVASEAAWPVQEAMHLTHTVETVSSAHSAAHLLNYSFGGFLSVAVGTGISSYMNRLALKEQEHDLAHRYRNQIGSILDKSPDSIGRDDLYEAAEINPSLAQELRRNKLMCHVRTGTVLVATTIAFAAVFAAMTVIAPLAALAGAAAAGGLFSAAGLGFVAATAALSFGALHVVSRGIGRLGKKIFGLNKPTIEDHVHELDGLYKKGNHLSQEQVMSVYVAAAPDMQESIKEQFGKPYHTLSRAQQSDVVAAFGDEIGVAAITDSINAGDLPVRELTFAVQGQSSGALPTGPKREHAQNEKVEELQDLNKDGPEPAHVPEANSRWQNAITTSRAATPAVQR